MILVFTHKVSPALHYVLEEIFSKRFHVEFEITNNLKYYQAAENPSKIKYTQTNETELAGYWIPNSDFLNRNFSETSDVNSFTTIQWIPMKKAEIIDSNFMEMLEILEFKNENFKLVQTKS